MSKILVLGDIHGRTIWEDIINKESPDEVVFLGDYVSTHDDVPARYQLYNLKEILSYKEENPSTVTLLRGNHDMQHAGYYWAECSGHEPDVAAKFPKDRFLADTSWVYIKDNILFSHAGVSQAWLNNNKLTVETINDQEPSEIFGFTPDSIFDNFGNSITQPPTWIRPQALVRCNVLNYTQVVGHTPLIKTITNVGEAARGKCDIWLCDALAIKKYLIIEDGQFKVQTYES